MSGYIKLHRKLYENDLLGRNPMARLVFIDLLTHVEWKDRVIDYRGRPYNIKRGQLMISVREISEKSGLSVRNIRTIVRALTNHNIIKIDNLGDRRPCLVTICNYDEYQDGRQLPDKQTDNYPTTTRQTYKEGEEGEEGKVTATAVTGRRAPMAKQMDLPTDMDPDLEHIRQTWNAYAKDTGKAQVRKLTRDRRDRIRQIMDDNHYTMAEFEEAMAKANQSDYLVEQPWFSFDWLWKEDSNLSKVCEGRYGNGRHADDRLSNGMTPKEYQEYVLNGGR